MGLLRAFGLIAIVVTLVVSAAAYANGLPIAALAPMGFAVLALLLVLPFPAYERPRQQSRAASPMRSSLMPPISCCRLRRRAG